MTDGIFEHSEKKSTLIFYDLFISTITTIISDGYDARVFAVLVMSYFGFLTLLVGILGAVSLAEVR